MRNLFLCFCFCFATALHAQTGLTLTLKVDNEANVGYLKSVFVTSYLKNTSDKEVKIVHPGFAEPLWYADKKQWDLTFNGNYVRPFQFVERPYTKFSKKKNNLTLKPGDSVAAGGYQLEFKEEGIYTVALTYTQQKAAADQNYVDKDLLKDNEDFEVKSEKISLNIRMKTVTAPAAPMPLSELQYTNISYSFADALANPDKAYKLILKGITPSDLRWLKELKNVQWLELTDANLDTLPAFLSDFKLQYFYYSSAKQAVNFPPGLKKLTTVKSLYLGGMALDSIPAWVYEQKDLEKLEIRVAQLKQITPSISRLTKLKELIVFWSFFERVPDELKKMTALERLSLESGALKNIDFLDDMTGLKFVKIAGSTSFRENPLINKLKQRNVEAYIF